MGCEEGGGRRQVDEAAKACFLEGMRAGLARDEAARRAGFTATAFYNARERDPVFRLAWRWAHDLSAADDRAAYRAPPEPGPDEVIAPNANRLLQRRRVRRRRFDDSRKRLYLDHFAGTADSHAAAEAAGVCHSAIVAHRRKDPDFAAAEAEALAVAYAALEIEALRQRLEAQRRLREGLSPTGEMSKEFERVMQLLARYERRGGAVGMRRVGPGRERRWSFDEAIVELDRRLRALGARHGVEAEPIALSLPPGEGTGEA